MKLQLLGSAGLWLDGEVVNLPTKKLLGLVAYLALEGQASRAKLADLFWSDNDEESARRNLRRELHRLRETVLREHLRTDDASVGLSEALITDVTQFQNLLERGETDAALALYRGELLSEFELPGAEGFAEWVQARREQLGRRWQNALLERAETLETKSDWRGALDIHLQLLASDNLQERHHREVMRLHHLLGAREAALAQFERCRDVLRHELGLEPLPETVQLAERIRAAQPPEPSQPNRSRPQRGAKTLPHLPLVGREAVQRQLEAHARSGRMVFVSGEPGVGKSSLIRAFAASRGAFALIEARSSDALVPFASLSRTIQHTLAAQPDLEMPAWMRRELSRFVPELSAEPPSPPRSLEERQYLYKAFAEWMGLAFRDALSLVVDDLQFFDAASFEMLLQAADGFSGVRDRCLLTSFRQSELSAEARAMLDHFVSDGRAALIELEPLSAPDLEQLVQTATGSAAGAWVAQLHRATGGNPFYALETICGLLDSGRWQPGTPQITDLPIPETVREAVSNRLRRLPVSSQRLLEVASLSGDGFSLESVSGATALSEWESLEALEQAVGAGVLEPFGTGHRFIHDLIRQAVEERLGAERRRLLHRALARNLERHGASPARIADHLERGGLALEAAPWHVRAARLAASMFANDAALKHGARALEIGLDDADAFAVRLVRLGVFEMLDDAQARARELDAMDVIATRLGNDALMAEVTLGRARLERNLGHYERALELSRSVKPQKTGSQTGAQTGTLAAQADFQAGAALMRLGRLIEAEDRFRQALEHLPRGMSTLRADVTDLLCTCALRQGKLEAARQWADVTVRAFRALEHRAGQLKAELNLGLIAGLQGDLADAIAIFDRVRTEATQVGHLPYQRQALGNLAYFALAGGEYEHARAAIDESLLLAREPRDPLLETTLLHNLGLVQCAAGQLGTALETLRVAAKIAEGTSSGQHLAYRQMALAELHLELGDPLGAQGALLSARDLVRTLRLDAIRLEIETLFARWEALRGQFDTALARLQGATGAAQEDVSREDRERALYVLACLTLRHAPDEACLLLEPLGHSRLNRVRLLTVQLQAQVAGYAVLAQPEDALEEATALLRGPLLPSNEFDLRRAVIRALGHAGLSSRAMAERTRAAERVHILAASLEAHPELRQSFIRLHNDLVPDGVV